MFMLENEGSKNNMSVGRGQLSHIVIKGYKSIKECNLSLNSINVLIGSNGAGKTNFISSFSLLQNILNKTCNFPYNRAVSILCFITEEK